MFRSASNLFRGICIAATLYAALFFAHIIAATQDWEVAFKIIAALITLMTFTVGPSIIVLGRVQNFEQKIQANAVGHSIGLVLSLALHGRMQTSPSIYFSLWLFFSSLPCSIQVIVGC